LDDEFDKVIEEAYIGTGCDEEDVNTWWLENGLYVQTACQPYRELLKGCAMAGVDVESPAFLEAIESSVQALIDAAGD
jgi:hypothetical protein